MPKPWKKSQKLLVKKLKTKPVACLERPMAKFSRVSNLHGQKLVVVCQYPEDRKIAHSAVGKMQPNMGSGLW